MTTTDIPDWVAVGATVHTHPGYDARGKRKGPAEYRTVTAITKTAVTLDDGSRWRVSDLTSIDTEPAPAQRKPLVGAASRRKLEDPQVVARLESAARVTKLAAAASQYQLHPSDMTAGALGDAIAAVAPDLGLDMPALLRAAGWVEWVDESGHEPKHYWARADADA